MLAVDDNLLPAIHDDDAVTIFLVAHIKQVQPHVPLPIIGLK